MILVSRADHCLHDLLYRYRTGELSCDISSVVSNHADSQPLVASYDVPFHHLPIDRSAQAEQERKLMALVREERAELVILARYMQILGGDLVDGASIRRRP